MTLNLNVPVVDLNKILVVINLLAYTQIKRKSSF